MRQHFATRRSVSRRASVSRAGLAFYAVGVAVFVGSLAALALYLRSLPAPVPARSDAELESVWGEAGSGDSAPSRPKPVARREPLGLRVYFTADGRQLHAQTIDPPGVQKPGERLRFVLSQLLNGPVLDFFQPTVPRGTRLRGAWIVGERAVVDLGTQVDDAPYGGPMAELLCVYSIVNTIAENVPGVREVQILVEGRRQGALWREVDISSPLRRDPSFIAR